MPFAQQTLPAAQTVTVGTVAISATLCLCVLSALAYLAYVKTFDKIEEILAESRAKRGLWFLVTSILLPAFITVVVDVIDCTALSTGSGIWRDFYLLHLLIVIGVVDAFGQLVWWSHSDAWEARIDQYRDDASSAIEARGQAKSERDFVLFVNNSFLGVVGIKASRVKLVRNNAVKDLELLKSSLSPQAQVVKLLTVTYEVLKHALPPSEKMRIAYFVKEGNYLVPTYSWDGTDSGCVKSPKKMSKEKFCISKAASECLAVYAAHSGRIETIADANAANTDGKCSFNYFSNSQRDNIRSIIAIPIGGGGPAEKVVCIDTTQTGYFCEETKWRAELIKENLERRLLFECDMDELLCDLAGDGTNDINT